MKNLISAATMVAAISMTPTLAAANNFGSNIDAHERCKRDEDNRQVLGGLAGAVVGGVFGSQVSGNGARTEGSAIGAVLGGLAGVGIADKSVDCDPVFSNQTSSPVYSNQGAPVYSNQGALQQAPQYGSTGYSGSSNTNYGNSTSYGSSQPYYEDRVTVSNHPVYSEPHYGAGAVSRGTTYSAQSVTYPPSGNNSQYASRTYNANAVSSPSVNTVVRAHPVRHVQSAPVYRAAAHQPAVYKSAYRSQPRLQQQPRFIQQQSYQTAVPHRVSSQSHHHGRYSCDMGH